MVFEIRRENGLNLVDVRFSGDVPVEVREALISNGFDWDRCRKVWSALDCHEDWAIRAIINAGLENVKERPVMSKAEEKALRDEYVALMMADGWEGERWRKFFEDRVGAIVKLTDGRLVNIEKPRIQTDFCFGESGYDADDAVRMAEIARTRESYFRAKNLADLKEEIEILSRSEDADSFRVPYVENDRAGTAEYHSGSACSIWGNRVNKEVSEEDRERLLEGYRKVYAAFEKRLNAYLKRYGLSKVHSWTYWRDA